MKLSRLFFLFALVLLFLVQGAPRLRAYALEGQTWPNGTITMTLQFGNEQLPLMDGSVFWNVVAEDALADWNPYLDKVQFGYVLDNNTADEAEGDNRNSVFYGSTVFGDTFGSEALAVTTRFYTGTTMTEADVTVNNAFQWNSYRGNLRLDSAGTDYIYDLRRVLDHEFGHVLGLDHPDQDGQTVVAIMNSVIGNLDHVAQDDINGVKFLYGVAETKGPALSISSPANGAVVGTANVTVTGTASDSGLGDDGIASVTVNGVAATGDTATGSGTANWSASVALTLGMNTITVVATDTLGNATTMDIMVTRADLPVITSLTPPSGTVGSSYRYLITATNPPLYIFGATGLPPGLQVGTTSGLISGKPTSSGTFPVTITARNAGGTGTAPVTITVNLAAQTIQFAAIPDQTTTSPPIILSAGASSGLPVTLTLVSGPATLSGDTLTLTGVAGNVVVKATQPGNDVFPAAASVTQSFTVSQTAQTITFPNIPDRSFGKAAIDLKATASSGLPVSYGIVSGPATISGNQLRLKGTGTVVVQASQAGNATWTPASDVTQSFNVDKLDQKITFPTIDSPVYGQKVALAATSSSGLRVIYSVLAGPADLSGASVTFIGTGTVILAVNQPGSTVYTPASQVKQTLKVGRASQTIAAFAAIPDKVFGNGPFFIAIPKATSGLAVKVTIKSGPATISGNKVTITGGGTVTLVANQPGNSSYTAALPVTTSFAVGRASQTITFPVIGTRTFGDAPFTLKATASSGLAVTYSIAGPATLSGNQVTLTGSGTVLVGAHQSGNASYIRAATVLQKFTVSPAK